MRQGGLVLLFLGALVGGCDQEEAKPLPGWGSDYEAAQAEAAKSGRPLAVLFTAPWSSLARRFETKTLGDAAVLKELQRFVRVRVPIDAQPQLMGEIKDEKGLAGVPTLLLVSPQKEKKVVRGSCSPAELAEFLGTLDDWKSLEGWESDPVRAKELSAASGKPLAILYSAAWETPAAAFERETLAAPAVREKMSGFTLLRLNLEANRAALKADKDIKAAPVLVLPAIIAVDGRAVVSGKCSGELLSSFIDGLVIWSAPPGWSTDHDAAAAEAKAGGKPLAVLLAKPADWPSHKFAALVLEDPAVKKALEPFVKVRLDYDKVAKGLLGEWQAPRPPCLIVRDAESKPQGSYVLKEDIAELTRRMAAELGKIAAGVPAKPPPTAPPPEGPR